MSETLTRAVQYTPPDAVILPVHLTRFIGRTNELSEVTRLLPGTRLLTLTGAGGSGKTRLAREAAAELSGGFERVGWVDLAPVSEPSLVAQLVAGALRLTDAVSDAPLE